MFEERLKRPYTHGFDTDVIVRGPGLIAASSVRALQSTYSGYRA